MKRNFTKRIRCTAAAVMAAILSFSALNAAVSNIITASAAEEPAITSVSHSYDFLVNTGKATPVKGSVLAGTTTETSGILWADTEGQNVSFDPTQLKFRAGTTLYLPIQNDTTKVTYTQVCSGLASPPRLTYVGGKGSAYSINMTANPGASITINDITDLIKEVNGQKYLPIYSNGDVKVTKITLTEYNPINAVAVTGKVANAAENGITEISFRNLDNTSAPLVTAAVDAQGNYSATLKRVAGNTSYVAAVSKTGFKVDSTDGANKLTLTGNTVSAAQNFNIVTAETAKLSGTVSGIPDSILKDTLKVKLVPADNTLDKLYLNLTKVSDGNYTFADAAISPDVTYSIALENANDYEVTATINKAAGVYSDIAVSAAAKALHKVSGSFTTFDKKTASVSKITFTNMNEAGYAYTFNVTGNTYTADLRAGEYVTSAVVDGYTVFDHVSVGSADVTNDVYLDGTKDTSAVEYKATLNVGKGKDFETISAASAYIKRMTRTEDQRVTINLTDSLYREQVIFDTPNVTLTSSNTTAPVITWYYGIGYSYYSVAPATDPAKGFYSEKYAFDKYTKTAVDTHWGTAVELSVNAKGFRSENITYESSFNRYMTTEEVADGVGPGGDSAKINRSIATNADVMTNGNKERACVMYIQADNCEFQNCSFLSSQDTMYTGNADESIYFKNCIIEGTTDFICGNGNPVFDSCTLSIYGYSNQAADGSFVTASKAGGSQGYLFNNCKIVKTTYPGINTTTKNIYLGRPWGAGTKVLYLNTEVATADLIAPAGYAAMSTVTPADAFYSEYNTHTPDGIVLNTTGRAAGTKILTADQAKNVSLLTYFGDWTPSYLAAPVVPAADYKAVDAAIAAAAALTASDYTDFSAVTAAVNAVVRDYKVADQAKVDAMAKAINDAVAALVKKPATPVAADYKAVDAAIAAAVALTASDYTDFSAVTTAVSAVVRDYKVADQAKVDAMAKAINDAVAALVKKPVAPVVDKTIVKENAVVNPTGQTFAVKLTAKEGVIPAGAKFETALMTTGAGFTSAAKAIPVESRFTLFDLSILDAGGVKVQPSGNLEISIDIPTGYSAEKTKVFRIEEDGSKTDMNATVQNGKVLFTVAHFSLYAVVEENTTVNTTPAVAPETAAVTVSATPIVQTGDSSMMWLFGIIMITSVSVLAAVCITGKKKEITE